MCRCWCGRISSLGLPASVQRNVRVQQRQRGYDEASVVESFLILNAVGGDCLEDFDRLREDAGLAEIPYGRIRVCIMCLTKTMFRKHDSY